LSSAEKYVLAAYLVVLVSVLAYVLIFSAKLARLDRDLEQLAELARARQVERQPRPDREKAPVG